MILRNNIDRLEKWYVQTDPQQSKAPWIWPIRSGPQRKARELHRLKNTVLSSCPFFWFEARSSPWARTWVDSCLPWTPLCLDFLRCYEGPCGPCEFLSWEALRWGVCKLHQRSSWIGFTTLTLAGSRIGPLMFVPGFISPMPQTTESPGSEWIIMYSYFYSRMLISIWF